MRNLSLYAIAALITICGTVVVVSGYLVNRQNDNTMPADVIKSFELRHSPQFLIDYDIIRSQFTSDELADPATTLPSNTNLPAQREIYMASKTCFQSGVPRFAPRSAEQKAVVWEQYRCGKLKSLPPGFFATQPFMHFSGQSYALLAQNFGLNTSSTLHMREFARQQNQQSSPSWRLIAELSRDSLEALYLSAPLVSDPRYLLIRTEGNDINARPAQYKIYDKMLWNTYLKDIGRQATPIQHRFSDQCEQVYGTFCWTHIKSMGAEKFERTFKLSLSLFVGLILCAFFSGLHRYRRRLQLLRDDRILLARVTAHELRTPVTNLKLIANTLSKTKTANDIAQISSDLNDQIRRLSLLTDASLLLLDSESMPDSKNSDPASEPLTQVIRILNDISARRGIILEKSADYDVVSKDATPIKVLCQLGMLQLCLENLLDNATKHGKPPIKISMTIDGNELRLDVRDEGSFSSSSVAKSGLGIGLDVVKSAMRRMGGSLRVQQNPTRVQLRLRITT